jgi:hypothetical protein
MKKVKLKYLLAFNLGLCACVAFGHDVPIHMKITVML